MNPHQRYPTSLIAAAQSFWRNRHLIWQMTRREVVGRYRGSFMGLAWSFFNPMIMLLVYTFVFSVVFKARFGLAAEESKAHFAVVLFVGIIVHGLFAEGVNRAPGLILSNVNYVTKMVFPLEIFPIVAMGSAVFHTVVSISVLLCAYLLVHGQLQWAALLLPVVLMPLALLTLGVAWFLASLGVFARDIGQVTGVITTVMLFCSPVFYRTSSLPAHVQDWLMLNPLTFIVEEARMVFIVGSAPDWIGLMIYSAISACVAWAGFWWFQKTRRGFADVV
jgi:lipopolysaccharide transport system permease protein